MKSETGGGGSSRCGSNRDSKTDRDQGSKKYLSHNNSRKDFHGRGKNSKNNRSEYYHSEDEEDNLMVMMNDHMVATEGYDNGGTKKRKGVLDITDYAVKTEG